MKINTIVVWNREYTAYGDLLCIVIPPNDLMRMKAIWFNVWATSKSALNEPLLDQKTKFTSKVSSLQDKNLMGHTEKK